MRSFYLLLLAATAFFASSEALPVATDSDQTKLTSAHNTANAKHASRTDDVGEEEEREGRWAKILSTWLSEDDAINVMSGWIARGDTIEKVAEHLKVPKYNEDNSNWNALVTFVQMKYKNVLDDEIPRAQAEAYLRRMFREN
ncbi:RxLR effector protein [Phytophthora megakarya]|uniref:RxLR effector protein n=1 Tax=Phytophthora megakarya TaxID=4795 RepID=A0A225X483_9STRA|nr:RxLR effector protein [Phytophthora megakarya]